MTQKSYSKGQGRPHTHQSLERGLRIIEAAAAIGNSATLSKIARETALPRSTAYHLLRALVELGYLVHDGNGRAYALAPRLFRLTGRTWTQAQLAEISIPFLDELSRLTGEGTSLAVMSERVVTIVAKRDCEGPVRVVQKVGATRPIHCTAVGKTLAAWLSEAELDAIINCISFERLTPKTITTPVAFRRELERVRASGFAIDNEEHMEGIRCMATPVREQSGEVCAALCIVGPKNRLSLRRLTELRKPLARVAADLSVRLGYGSIRGMAEKSPEEAGQRIALRDGRNISNRKEGDNDH
ncbi:MAG: IclR family transcriptional regulator [Syntrophaceae bacterium]|nr:IclR family transcriptional regulator [Syntrophaceae bacterium]